MKHFVRNIRTLAKGKLRKDALAILEAGLHAINTEEAIRRSVHRTGNILKIQNRSYQLDRYRNIHVLAVGKVAFDAAKTLEQILGSRITDGVVLDVKVGLLKRLTCRKGTHPFPSLPNMKATGEMLGILKHLEKDDLVLVVVSGGGSSLLCWPTDLSCENLSLLTRTLMEKGATIEEINTVRKHTSDIQGGQLAALAQPAQVVGLIFSDVVGNELSTVASGPTFLDKTTVEDAQVILNKYHLLQACHLPSCTLKETPKDKNIFRSVSNILIVSNREAVNAMKEEAKRLGFTTIILPRMGKDSKMKKESKIKFIEIKTLKEGIDSIDILKQQTFRYLAQRDGASRAIFQQKNMRVNKNMLF